MVQFYLRFKVKKMSLSLLLNMFIATLKIILKLHIKKYKKNNSIFTLTLQFTF